MTVDRYKTKPLGSKRTVTKFLWLPLKLYNKTSFIYEWRWLSSEDIHQEYWPIYDKNDFTKVIGYDWKNDSWCY